MSSGRYIVTSAAYNMPVFHGFRRSLESFAQEKDAEIIVLTMRELLSHEDFPIGLEHFHIVPEGVQQKLNNKIRVDNYNIRPQQIDPITGLARFTQSDVSTIFASPKQRLKVIPNSNNKLPKILMTSGAITKPNYREGFRITDIAKRDHVLGAIYVETLDGTNYHFRHLTANSYGHFADMGIRWRGNEDPTPSKLEALVLGDIHVGDTDQQAMKANYEMIETLHPKRIVLHDLFNGHSVNHHERNRLINRAKQYRSNLHLLEKELEDVAGVLEEIVGRSNGAEIIIPACNHHDFLTTYLQDSQFVNEPHNLYVAAKLIPTVIDGQDPVKTGIGFFYDVPDNVRFLRRDEDYKVMGWQLGAHGDKGDNGAKGSIRSRENAYGKSITAHTHTPEIQRNTFVVGTSTRLNLDYTSGPSSWMNTNALLWDTGKAQLLNIINGKWR